MARSYANIFTAIWQDPDWRALHAGQQRTFLMLVTQSNISAAGTMPLTVRRWAAGAGDTSPADIRADLDALAATNYIVVDEDTEELLVRSFVGHDKGYANEKRRRSITDAAAQIESPALRRALSIEFVKVGLPPLDADGPLDPHPQNRDRASDRASTAPAESDTEAKSPETTEPSIVVVDNVFAQVDRASDTASDGTYQNRRSVVTEVEYLVPHSTIHNPQSALRSGRDAAPDRALTFVVEATGATEDEANSVLDEIRRQHRPKSLAGYVRVMHGNGDLATAVDEHRRRLALARQSAARKAQLAAIDADAALPPDGPATPRDAAEARRHIRELLSGRHQRGGEPSPAFARARTA